MNAHDNLQAGRNDAAVFAEARKRLDDSPAVPNTVRVHVDDGLVTLTGTVERPAQRAEAARIVQPVIGSRRLVDCIVILPRQRADDVDAPDERA